MSELLPCPFCGSKAITVNHENGGTYGWSIMCTNVYRCCTHKGMDGSIEIGKEREFGIYPSEQEAIAAWNTRAEGACTFKAEFALNGWLDWRCSNCNEVIANTDVHVILCFNYFPNCGAKVVSE